jgi:hypothetical protein
LAHPSARCHRSIDSSTPIRPGGIAVRGLVAARRRDRGGSVRRQVSRDNARSSTHAIRDGDCEVLDAVLDVVVILRARLRRAGVDDRARCGRRGDGCDARLAPRPAWTSRSLSLETEDRCDREKLVGIGDRVEVANQAALDLDRDEGDRMTVADRHELTLATTGQREQHRP